ncbi:hypothetical protein CkaCkLH20_02379 [Colletotrichum karsti]|uniref:F-box domain-containing protein n=1 Tax=Colletotrichum karsti TaxID=1095194 RepID=A0A9P6LP50_9PEZI|nr:uncharacterized protein CkaCkLH20_02379 [Colletotrichum karsti]KAF9880425.1 hypothetical protein CkaCkLH20_02379 [Colletotrichum karsti]
MASTAPTLPSELIVEICSYFYRDKTEIDYAQDWLRTQRQLFAVCLASKAFYELVQPYLYRQVNVSLHNLTGTRYLSLLRTLISRPDLGERVRDLKLDVCIPYVSPGEIDRANMATFLDITRQWSWNKSVRSSVGSNWTNDPQRTQEALVDLLLAHLPKLNIVHLSIGRYSYGSGIPTQHLAGPSYLFAKSMAKRVTSLHVYHSDLTRFSLNPGYTYTPHISNFLEYFSTDLAKIVTRRCDRLLDRDVFCFGSLQDVSLYDVSLDDSSMGLLMDACHGLHRFAYTSWSSATVTPNACLRALEQHSSTLVDIYLRLTYPELKVVTSGGYESFHMFTKLEKLKVFPRDFEGANNKAINNLPKSLKHFTLSYWSVASTKDVVAFVETAAQVFFPQLETFDVHLFQTGGFHAEMLASSIKAAVMGKLGTKLFKFRVHVLHRLLEDPRK